MIYVLFSISFIGLMLVTVYVFILKKQKRQYEEFRKFEWKAASDLDLEELFKSVVEALRSITKERILVFLKKEETGEYELVPLDRQDSEPDDKKKQEILRAFSSDEEQQHPEIAALKYDKTICGFIYIDFSQKVKMKRADVEYFQQVAAYASICMKNSNQYREAYRNSIHDELTGLYNQRYYKNFIKECWVSQMPQAFVCFDIDNFRLLNQLYGDSMSDEVLKWCSSIIVEAAGPKSTVFRIGSNEFLLYIRNKSEEDLVSIASEIRKRLAQGKEGRPNVMQAITLSIGIACYPEVAMDADSLLEKAERAAFFAKSDGGNGIRVYRSEELRANVSKCYEQIAPTVYALVAAIDAKDEYTYEHSVHVSEYAVLLAREIGLSPSEVRIIQEAGMLHDIGKIGIPDHVLKKKGKYSKEEYEIMKTHVMNSVKMIPYLPNMNYVTSAIVSHHERYDGKGYPKGIKGEEIPLLGRILAICDCYDAMISKRSYKEEMTVENAIAELEKNRGTQFDPVLTDAFIKLVKEGRINK